MEKISCVIITLNEERNIGRCLESVKDVADEIIVIDSFSKDSTESICKQYAATFIKNEWLGYADTKNLGNNKATNNWILSMDADEALSDQLKKSILDLKEQGIIVKGKFNRLSNYCGKWIHHSGWYPDAKIRLFDRRTTRWTGTIHETLQSDTENDVVKLSGDCYHYSYYTIDEHYRQVEKYSSLAAQELFRRKKTTSMLQIYFRYCLKFLRNYFVRLGFLDGKAGFIISKITAHETYLKYDKLLQLNRQNKTETV